MGSKDRNAKHILPHILQYLDKNTWYVEPFVGGFNMMDKLPNHDKRIAADNHYYLIELYKAVQQGWVPPTSISKSEYRDIQKNKEKYPAELVGFVGFGCSFGGKWFGGYATDKIGKRNYCLESHNNILRQAEGIKGVEIYCCEYDSLPIPEGSVIYLDPPYYGKTKYASGLDYTKFYEWMSNLVHDGHTVFLSEYTPPPPPFSFRLLWEKDVKSSLKTTGKFKTEVEKLFLLEGS
jgi:DNA adenine methylase